MRAARRAVPVVLAATVALVLFSTPVHASCAQASVARQTQVSDAVFVGSTTQGGSSVAVRVSEVYKGVVGRTVHVDGGDSDAGTHATFRAGAEYVFFAKGSGPRWSTDACAGTHPAGSRVVAAVQRALGSPSAPAASGLSARPERGRARKGVGVAVLLAVAAALVLPRARRHRQGGEPRRRAPGSVGSGS